MGEPRGPSDDAEPIHDAPQERAARPSTPLRRWLGRTWWIILIVTAAGTAFSVALSRNLTPLYRAEAVFALERGIPNGSSATMPVAGESDPAIAALRSRPLVALVIDDLAQAGYDLSRDERRGPFGAVMAMVGLSSTTDLVPERWKGVVEEDPADLALRRERAISLVLRHLAIDTGPATTLAFTGPDARLAAAIVNGLVAAFALHMSEIRADGPMRARAWLAEQLARLGAVDPASQQLHETALAALDLAGRAAVPEVRLVAAAAVPPAPSAPDRDLIAAIGSASALLLGLLIAGLVEAMRAGFLSPEHVRARTGLPTVAALPTSAAARRLDPQHQLKLVGAPAAEEMRGLHALLGALRAPPGTIRGQVLAVTSAERGEGKTVLALALARLASLSGWRVILIDGSMDHPALDRASGVPNRLGLSECLARRTALEDVIEIDRPSRAHLLLAGRLRRRGVRLLNRRVTADFLDALTRVYDLVIVDTPAVLGPGRNLGLIRHADQVVLVIRCRETRRHKVFAALRRLRRRGIHRVFGALTGGKTVSDPSGPGETFGPAGSGSPGRLTATPGGFT